MDGTSCFNFLQVTSALGCSGIVSGKILKVGEFPSKRLQAVKNTFLLQRSCQFQLWCSGFCRKQLHKNGGLYGQGINSFKMVFLY
uniref:Uncharacterized protein n=1 Tax=Arundo donax TaxID=35708 RepID=A0A0A9FDC6_ARUDO